MSFVFFFNDTATTEIYTYCHTLSLHYALPISELRRVRLGDHHAAARLHPLDQRVRGLRHVIRMDRRAVGGAHPGDVHQVLDGDGEAGEPATSAVRRGRRQSPRGLPGAVEDRKSTRLNSSH